MSKQSGLGDHLLVDGYDLSGDIGSIQRIGGGPTAMDLTDITQSGYGRVGGERGGEIEFSSWFDKATAAEHPVLSTLPTTDRAITYCRGYGLGSPAASMIGKQIGYDGNRGADGSFSLSVATQSNAYSLEWGLQLTASGMRTDTVATNGASIDGGAATTFGAQFYLHVTALTGTSVTVKIQDSADNSAWLDLSGAAFTAATGRTSERIAVTGTVRRYLRVVTTGTFTNASFLVNSVRNATAVVF